MRRLAALVGAALAMVAGTVFPAAGQDAVACTEIADVSWETNWDDVTVEAARVHVPGCDDGDEVGLQLLTDDGDLPAEPLVGTVQDERVRFDLAALDVRIEPVTGVRVLLYGEVVVEIHHVMVEQRFFSDSGNEQRGLRRTTDLEVADGGTYRVPGAPPRYDVASCDSTRRWSPPADLVGQGAGAFTATASGTHVVCYRQRPGTSGGPSDVEDPTVDETAVLGVDVDARRPSPGSSGGVGGRLASTGADVLGLGVVALVMLVVGRRITRRTGRSAPQP